MPAQSLCRSCLSGAPPTGFTGCRQQCLAAGTCCRCAWRNATEKCVSCCCRQGAVVSHSHQAGDGFACMSLHPADVVCEQCAADQQAALHQHQQRLLAEGPRHTTVGQWRQAAVWGQQTRNRCLHGEHPLAVGMQGAGYILGEGGGGPGRMQLARSHCHTIWRCSGAEHVSCCTTNRSRVCWCTTSCALTCSGWSIAA